jgi:hypothetical protein
MISYNSILLTLVIEGLVKSYTIPKAIDKYNLDETGTFYLLLIILSFLSIFEFFFLSRCINTETIGDVTEENAAGELFLLITVTLIVNYGWFIKIYKRFNFWTTIGILSVVGFANEFNNIIITSVLREVTNTECSRY